MSGPVPKRPASLRPHHQRLAAERNKEADQRRGTAHQRGYDTKWSREAKAYREENPLCVGCKACGRTVAATLTDHIVPHKRDDKLFWRRSNWQALCKWHHDKVKQILETRWAEGKLDVAALRIDSPQAMALTRQLWGV